MSTGPAKDVVVVPVKGLRLGKSRLSVGLPDEVRHALNRLQLSDTLAAVGRVFGQSNCMVISGCGEALQLARDNGMRALAEPSPYDLNRALAYARDVLRQDGAGMMTVIPVDLPHIDAAVLDALLRRCEPTDSVIVPDSALRGTNVLRFAVSLPFAFGYGSDSFGHHVRALIGCGVVPRCFADSPLSADLDVMADFVTIPRYRKLLQDRGGGQGELLAAGYGYA